MLLTKEHKDLGLTKENMPKNNDIWEADTLLAWQIYPILVRFKAMERCGHPQDLNEESWEKILDCMVTAFALTLINLTDVRTDLSNKILKDKEYQEDGMIFLNDDIQEGLTYFGNISNICGIKNKNY